MNALDVRNLSFNYKGAFVFDKFNLQIEKGSFVTIIGNGGVGKSTLFKIFSDQLSYSGSIYVFNKSIGYCLSNGKLGLISVDLNYFRKKIVIDELIQVLKDKGTSFDKIKSSIDRAVRKTGIKKILNNNINDLNLKEKVLFMLTIQLLNKPDLLIMDNVFGYLDIEKSVILKELKRLNKKCTIINITNNTEECLYGKRIVILGDNVIDKSVKDINVLDFSSHDLEIPFIISLSEKLKFYDLISDVYFDMDKLVDVLWQ